MSYQSLFLEIDQLLFETQQFWQCVAFSQRKIPWPRLEAQLLALTDAEVELLDTNPQALQQYLVSFIPQLAKAEQLILLPRNETKTESFPFWLTNGIKGSKIAQLERFIAQTNTAGLPILEWCAGKGHLGRLFSYSAQVPIHSVEIQGPLVEQGRALAQQFELDIRLDELDVLSARAESFLQREQHAVALHACGGLHQALLQHGVKKQTKQLSISPCCYHLFQSSDKYLAMSKLAKSTKLVLSANDLKLCLQETVTSGQRVKRLRETETHWRLAFDCLLDDVLNKSEYLPIPSAKKALFNAEFSDFCHWAAGQKGICLPERIDYDYYLSQGRVRLRVAKRVELVRHAFRRLIELWLVLDRVLYLEQFGYHVEVSEFCEKHITPRNILIQAYKF